MAAWLPGTEGAGLADVLLGDVAFRGKTPYTWPAAGHGLDASGGLLGPEACDAGNR